MTLEVLLAAFMFISSIIMILCVVFLAGAVDETEHALIMGVTAAFCVVFYLLVECALFLDGMLKNGLN